MNNRESLKFNLLHLALHSHLKQHGWSAVVATNNGSWFKPHCEEYPIRLNISHMHVTAFVGSRSVGVELISNILSDPDKGIWMNYFIGSI